MEEHTVRKLAVILHADVVGSTALVQHDERLAHGRIHTEARSTAEDVRMFTVPFLVGVLTLSMLAPLDAAEIRTPQETVDTFHDALRNGDPALALSVLTRDVIVYEMGLVDQSRNAYAASHLPADMKAAAGYKQELLRRRIGGTGDQRWIVSTYRRRSKDLAWTELETIFLRQVGGNWRITHIHWSSEPR